ncbi:ribose 5-phosphate isomerase B [uncultured Porphyromonas sp.]|uniref:ribose 5-phosphate isomerase B n=1 Tax=uncultured Porphyromonas sp. TaxID=159274 RepID=UPI0035A8AEEF
MNINKVGLASDHAGFEIKEVVKNFLDEWLGESEIYDFGTYSEDRVDYPDFAHKLGNAIDSGEVEWGVIVCGSGNGIAMAANKHPHVRAGLAWNTEQAELTRQHNNANVLSIPGRFVTPDEARAITRTFFETEFEGGRHTARVAKIPLQD